MIFIDPTGVIPGEPSHYTMSFASLGATAQNAVITDVLPPYTTFLSANPAPGWTCGPAAVGGQPAVRCTTPSLAQQPPFSNWASMSIDVGTAPDMPLNSILTNTVTISSDTPESNPDNNTASTTNRPSPVDYYADISTSSSVSPPAVPIGGLATVVVTVRNLGPSSSLYTTFEDTLPAFVSFVGIDAPGWSCNPPPVGSSGKITCDRNQFLPGVESIRISVQADQVGQGSNIATVIPSAVDFTPDEWNTTASVAAVAPAILAVPTLSTLGLAALGLLLLGAGIAVLRFRA